MGNLADSRPAFHQSLPIFLDAGTQRRDQPNAGHDDSSRFNCAHVFNQSVMDLVAPLHSPLDAKAWLGLSGRTAPTSLQASTQRFPNRAVAMFVDDLR